MTINERIIRAAQTVVPVCVPDLYDPDKGDAVDEFCVFSYTSSPDFFCDNVPTLMRYSISVVLVLPLKRPSLTQRNGLQRAFFEAGFEVQDVTNISTEDYQEYEFALEYAEVLESWK